MHDKCTLLLLLHIEIEAKNSQAGSGSVAQPTMVTGLKLEKGFLNHHNILCSRQLLLINYRTRTAISESLMTF